MLQLLVVISLWKIIKQYCHLLYLLQRLHNLNLNNKVTDGKCNHHITSDGNIFRHGLELSPNCQQTNLTSWYSIGITPVFGEKPSSVSPVLPVPQLRKLDAGLQRPRFNLKSTVAMRKVSLQVLQFSPVNHIWECSNRRLHFTPTTNYTCHEISSITLTMQEESYSEMYVILIIKPKTLKSVQTSLVQKKKLEKTGQPS